LIIWIGIRIIGERSGWFFVGGIVSCPNVRGGGFGVEYFVLGGEKIIGGDDSYWARVFFFVVFFLFVFCGR
jgi:hypothetical protein